MTAITKMKTSMENAGISEEESVRILRLVPQLVIEATERMYSDAGTDEDALIYTGSIINSMLGTANAVVSMGLITGDVSRNSYEALSKSASDCRGLAAMLDGKGFQISAELARNAAETLRTIGAAIFLMIPPANVGKKRLVHVKTYIVRSGLGLIKIGRSQDVEGRVKSLQTGAGGRIEVLFVIDGDVERELHRKFADIRVFGEWFSDDGRIAAYIDEMKRGDA